MMSDDNYNLTHDHHDDVMCEDVVGRTYQAAAADNVDPTILTVFVDNNNYKGVLCDVSLDIVNDPKLFCKDSKGVVVVRMRNGGLIDEVFNEFPVNGMSIVAPPAAPPELSGVDISTIKLRSGGTECVHSSAMVATKCVIIIKDDHHSANHQMKPNIMVKHTKNALITIVNDTMPQGCVE